MSLRGPRGLPKFQTVHPNWRIRVKFKFKFKFKLYLIRVQLYGGKSGDQSAKHIIANHSHHGLLVDMMMMIMMMTDD